LKKAVKPLPFLEQDFDGNIISNIKQSNTEMLKDQAWTKFQISLGARYK
jgi:hypothetical protein